MGARHVSLSAALLLAAAAPSIEAAAPPPPQRLVALSCKQAVSESRMVCLTGSNCQREISPILRTCHAPDRASCSAAREELRTYCAPQSKWYGTRECEEALAQVSHYCAER
jgi:hypothetical protein